MKNPQHALNIARPFTKDEVVANLIQQLKEARLEWGKQQSEIVFWKNEAKELELKLKKNQQELHDCKQALVSNAKLLAKLGNELGELRKK